jgi:hypothetical protein
VQLEVIVFVGGERYSTIVGLFGHAQNTEVPIRKRLPKFEVRRMNVGHQK